jgi:hypothetical protein
MPTSTVARPSPLLHRGSTEGPIARILGTDALTLAPCLRAPATAPAGILTAARPTQVRLLARWLETVRGHPVAAPAIRDSGAPPLTALQLLARAAALLTRNARAPAAHPDVVDADRLLVVTQLAGGLVDPDDPAVTAALARAAPPTGPRTARVLAALRRLCAAVGHAPTNAELDAAEANRTSR